MATENDWHIEYPGDPFDEDFRTVPSAFWTKEEKTREILSMRNSLLKFGLYVRPQATFDDEKGKYIKGIEPHFKIIEYLEEMAKRNPDYKKVAISLPRGYAKSFWVNTWILWCLVYQKFKFMLYVGDSSEKVTEEIESIREDLNNNARIIHLYGHLLDKKKNVTDKKRKQRVVEKSGKIILNNRGVLTYESLSSESGKFPNKLRGMRVGQKRMEVAVWDDSESPYHNKDSENMKRFLAWRNQQVRWGGDAENIREVVANTVMGPFSWVKSLVENPEWKSVYRTCWADKDRQIPLWGERYSKEWILAEREAAIKDGIYTEYLLEIENTATDTLYSTFNINALRYHNSVGVGNYNMANLIECDLFKSNKEKLEEKIKRSIDIITVVDPANSASIDSDYFAAIILGLDELGNYFILGMIRERGTEWDRMAKRIVELSTELGSRGIYVEDEAMQKTFITWIRNVGTHIPVIPWKSRIRDKDARIQRIKPYLNNGRLYIPLSYQYTTMEVKADDGQILEASRPIDLTDVLKEDLRVYKPGSKSHRLDLLDAIGIGMEIVYPKDKFKEAEEDPWAFLYRHSKDSPSSKSNSGGFGRIHR